MSLQNTSIAAAVAAEISASLQAFVAGGQRPDAATLKRLGQTAGMVGLSAASRMCLLLSGGLDAESAGKPLPENFSTGFDNALSLLVSHLGDIVGDALLAPTYMGGSYAELAELLRQRPALPGELFLPWIPDVSEWCGLSPKPLAPEEFAIVMGRYRNDFQKRCLAFHKDGDLDALKEMRRILVSIQSRNPHQELALFIECAIVVVEAMLDGDAAGANDKAVLLRINMELGAIAKGGLEPNEDLVCALLYGIATSNTAGARARRIADKLCLGQFVEFMDDGLRSCYVKFNAALPRLREAWNNHAQPNGMRAFRAMMEQVRDKAPALKNAEFSALAGEVARLAEAIDGQQLQVNMALSLEVAGALLLMEEVLKLAPAQRATVGERVAQAQANVAAMMTGGAVSASAVEISDHDRNQTVAKTCENLLKTLALIEQEMQRGDSEGEMDVELLTQSFAQLTGVMAALELEEALPLAEQAAELASSALLLEDEEKDAFAEMVAFIDLYIKALANGSFAEGARVIQRANETFFPKAAEDVPQSSCEERSIDRAVDEEMLDIYLDEADEILLELERALPDCATAQQKSALATVRRSFHTIKGSGRMVGLDRLAEVAWDTERTLNHYIEAGEVVTEELLAFATRAAQYFREAIARLRAQREIEVDQTLLKAEADCLIALDLTSVTRLTVEAPKPASDDLFAGIALAAPAVEVPEEVEASPLPVLAEPEADPLVALAGRRVEQWLKDTYLREMARLVGGLQVELELFRESGEISPDLLRYIHTVASNSATAGIVEIRDLAHAVEDVLAAAQRNGYEVQGAERASLALAIESVGAMFDVVVDEGAPEGRSDLIGELRAIADRIEHRDSASEGEDKTLPQVAEPLPLTTETEPPQGIAMPATELAAPATDEAEYAELEAFVMPEAEPGMVSPSTENRSGSGPAPLFNFETATRPLLESVSMSSDIQDDIDPAVVPIFIEETRERLHAIPELLARWIEHDDAQAMGEIKRYSHTIKSSARMAGAMRFGDVMHKLESMIDGIEAGSISDVKAAKRVVEEGYDLAIRYVEHFGEGTISDAGILAEDTRETKQSLADFYFTVGSHVRDDGLLKVFQEGAAAAEGDGRKRQDVSRQPHIRVPFARLDQLETDAGEAFIQLSRIEGGVSLALGAAIDVVSTVNRMTDLMADLSLQTEFQLQSNNEQISERWDPLEMDRFTAIQELARMLDECTFDIKDRIDALSTNLTGVRDSVADQGRVIDNIQHGILHSRMVPFDSIGGRLFRVLRDACRETGKKASLEMSGEVEADANIVEALAAPLEHIVRNAIVHGIEDPEERLAAGKPETGVVRVRVSQAREMVNVVVSDDGAGIDLARVVVKAKASGIVAEHAILDDEAAGNLIFEPGFSTAKEVSVLAGRGVGLDVVKNEVTALGGTVTVSGAKGRGASFHIATPTSLSSAFAIPVSAAGYAYAIPTGLIEEVCSVAGDELSQAYTTGRIRLPGYQDPVPFAGLNQALGLDCEVSSTSKNNPIIVMRRDLSRKVLALHVETTEPFRKYIVKKIPGVPAGILGGSVDHQGGTVLLINPMSMAAEVKSSQKSTMVMRNAVGAPARATTVMVVDDSVTVRKMTDLALKKEGMMTILAKDGQDAVAHLAKTIPDIILLDLEMPRMNGFELTSYVRSHPNALVRQIPILIISSRSSEKHKKHAMELGADMYFAKPYRVGELVEQIRAYERRERKAA